MVPPTSTENLLRSCLLSLLLLCSCQAHLSINQQDGSKLSKVLLENDVHPEENIVHLQSEVVMHNEDR